MIKREQLNKNASDAMEICLCFTLANELERQHVLLHYHQAIEKNQLDIESYNCILEFAPHAARILANYFNISISQLRGRVIKDGISGIDLEAALSQSLESLRAECKK